jgi:quaternary ammonium compound-resistance protein SugE
LARPPARQAAPPSPATPQRRAAICAAPQASSTLLTLLGFASIHMAWIILVLAGVFEIGWAIGLKYTEGFTRLWPTVWTAVSLLSSMALLGIAMKTLPVGTAYSVWVGVGAVGTVILGIALLGEPANAARVVSVALIVIGIVGLKLATPS